MRTIRDAAAASSCSPSASTAPASSTIPAISISSCSSIPANGGVVGPGRGHDLLQPPGAQSRQAAGGADGGRLRPSRRLPPASGPRLDAGRGVARRRLHLLRDGWPELGAGRADQGAARRRRPRPRRALPQGSRAVHLAQVFRLRLDRRRSRHEAADPRGARARRDRRRRSRHQARTRRHPRDRVLRADAAARLRRPAPRPARATHPRHARRAPPRGLDHAGGARRADRRLPLPSLDRAPPADGRGRADAAASVRPRGAGALRQVLRLCQPQSLRESSVRSRAQGPGALRAAVRGGRRPRLRGRQPCLHRHGRRPGNARDAAPARVPQPGRERRRPCAAGISAAGPR